MTKTNQGLVDYAQQALSEKWGYCLGTYGNTLTQTLLVQKCAQGNGVGTYNTSHKDYLWGFIGKRVSDCYGLVKGYLWTEGVDEPKYNSAQDRNQEGAYNAAKEKGVLATLPEIPGLVLWMSGHAGVYIGGGEFIECAGCPTGAKKGTIKNGAVTSGSKFTHWFKDTYIEYLPVTEAVTEQTPAEAEAESTVKFNLFGKIADIPGQLIDGSNYVAARALLEAMGYAVAWENGVVIVTMPSATVKIDLFGQNTVEIPGWLLNGTNYVALRAMMEAMEFEVGWVNDMVTVRV